MKIIQGIVGEIEVGDVFDAKVVKIAEFGAFVEFLPGREGLIHISKLAHRRVNRVSDVVKVGDVFPAKVIEIDRQGRVNLSRKDAMPAE